MGLKVLITGATGYIGGRLVPRLLESGHAVRVLVREADPIKGRPWENDVEVVQGDLLKPGTLDAAVAGVDVAYYLVHSMVGGDDFAQRDRDAATNFVDAVKRAHGSGARAPRHVIYLGGLEPKGESTRSAHLRSRAEVGRLLAEGLATADEDESSGAKPQAARNEDGSKRGVKTSGGGGVRVTEFRAGPIIGSGSASFEMLRYLTERIPVMITPRWIYTKVQPIAVRDVLAYLEAALHLTSDSGGGGWSCVVEIGTDVRTFKDMMLEVAQQRGHRRLIIPTPVLAPKLAARWVGLVTPIPNALAVPLVAGVTQDLLADTTGAEEMFPGVEPISYREAVALALTQIERGEVETRWSGAAVELSTGDGGADVDTVKEDREGLARDQRTLVTDVPAQHVFAAVTSVGGEKGWPAYGWAWWLRGVFDALIGGPGLRRGRRHPTQLLEGETLDWWRVDKIEPPPPPPESSNAKKRSVKDATSVGLLRLRAEMKLPGRAWLQWEVGRRDGQTRLRQTALFEPRGLTGTLYWYAMLPAHGFIFPGLLRGLEREARRLWQQADSVSASSDRAAVPPASTAEGKS